MELEKNGCFVQRRKMYIGLPQHNMRSHLSFEWQDNDQSFQDQVGSRFKLKQENQLIRKKYTDSLDQKIYHKYVEHVEDQPFADRDTYMQSRPTKDTLTRQLQHFNTSKTISPPPDKAEASLNEGNLMYNSQEATQKYNRGYDSLNQSLNLGQSLPKQSSPLAQRQSSLEPPTIEPANNLSSSNYRYNRRYYPAYYPNPQSYQTISPAPDRYRPYQPNPYANYPSPSKSIQKLATGTIPGPNDYPFRNIIPDKLQNHLRDKLKADRKSLKVSLNLFDYKKP